MHEYNLRILLVDEQPDRFDCMVKALRSSALEIAARVSTKDDWIAAAEKIRPAAIIFDLETPDCNTLRACNSFHAVSLVQS